MIGDENMEDRTDEGKESRKKRREDEREREDSRGEERFHIFVVFNII